MQKTLKGMLAILLLSSSPVLFSQDKTIKIGVAGPFTGSYAAYGDQLWRGVMQAAADINQTGGIDGAQIVLIKADDACEPKQAITVSNRLVNDQKVIAVIGHFCSSCTLPASDVYADSQVLMITPASTNPIITEKGYKTVFRTCGRDDEQGKVAADFIHNQLKARKVAILHDRDSYGKGLADIVKAKLEKDGVKITAYEGLTRGEKDFTALVTKILETQPDAIYFGGIHSEAGPLVRQLREKNYLGPFVSGDGIVTDDFVSAAGGPSMVKGVYMTFSAEARKLPSTQKVVEELRKQHFEPEGYTLYSYAALQMIADAIKNTHSDKGEVLSEWIHHHPINTILGSKQWDEKGDLKNANYVIYQWNDNGKYEELNKPK